ncbi:chalcone isomerase family protein [Pseudoteredinibacter isoporae]|uniref:Chalcone isomerase domain-containing protein n=1 Tax=Pseudoteredinibacter isoporae TaxID=570281 RepID=A0A7X0JVJ3_9GAMM|nr:hypothetical protein [Pseudoteredinibacter isoporae]NHO88554.1 hypothetical protein [Pseudoteredinibacter isoporae]NIB22755.1 hypothetical protein [Pseudoteredinibacter isoporae]
MLISCLPPFATASEKLQVVGSTRFSVLWFDVYDATLYSPSGRYQQEQYPLQLTLDYLRDISAQRLLNETRKQWKTVPDLDNTQREQWLAELSRVWPDINESDRLSFILHSEDKGEFRMFDESLGVIESPGFARAFINIWIGPHSQYPSQAKKLLGETK